LVETVSTSSFGCGTRTLGPSISGMKCYCFKVCLKTDRSIELKEQAAYLWKDI
jgi:hypothetical protein